MDQFEETVSAEMEGIGSRGGRIVLVPLPYQGHLTPMLQLATILHSKGFSITVVHTTFNPPSPSNYPQFDFIPIPHGLSDLEVASGDFIAVISSLNANCGTALHESLLQLIDSHTQIACVIYDALMYCAEVVAKHLELPGIILRTTGAYNVLTYDVYPLLQQGGDNPIPESELMEVIPGMDPIRYMDLPIHNFYNVKAYLELVSQVSNVRSSSAVIWNTVDCLEQPALAQLQQQYQVPIFSVGPLHKFAKPSSSSLIKEDTSCIDWLDKHPNNSVLYVSLGSIAQAEANELTEMAWGLANSKQAFLWVIRSGSEQWSELLPPGFTDMVGDRGCIVKWAPQRKVLEHNAVGGFWSHCGWNSTIESVAEGVPLICRPCFADQRVNARYLTQVWKIGMPLENDLERGEIERTVRRMMVEEEGSIMRQKATDLKKKIEISIREGGSSHNSLCELVDFILS